MTAQETPATARRRHKGHVERGAAAVEMALVMPLLLAMFVGIIDFSRIFNAELQLSQAAREGVRLASLQMWSSDPAVVTANAAKVAARAVLAAPNPAFGMPLTATGVQVLTVCPDKPTDQVAVVQVSYVFHGIFWMNGSTLTQKAVMRCSG